MTKGVELISVERQRQIEVEGWTQEHDAHHDNQELAHAAVVYTQRPLGGAASGRTSLATMTHTTLSSVGRGSGSGGSPPTTPSATWSKPVRSSSPRSTGCWRPRKREGRIDD